MQQVGSLECFDANLTYDSKGEDVNELFLKYANLPGVSILKRNSEDPNIIIREPFMELFASRFGREIYSKKPALDICHILKDQLLIVKEDEDIAHVVKKSFNRPEKRIFDPVIISFEDDTYKILRLETLLKSENKTLFRLKNDLKEQKHLTEEALQIKEMFLANISHEIRTPLNGIIGAIEILSCENLSDDGNQIIDIVKRSGSHLLNLVNDLLDYTKLNEGKFSLNIRPFNLKEVMADIREICLPQAKAKNLSLTIVYPENVLVAFQGDPTRVKQIIMNLVSNAIKFTQEGFVIIRTFLRSQDRESCQLHIEVEDSGIGISPENTGSLFDEFTQVDNTMTRTQGGTGLGLAISQKLAKLMNGELKVNSVQEQGSVFTLDIKLPYIETAPSHSTSSLNDYKINEKFLVADDNLENQTLLRTMLVKAGGTVTLVKNGQEAFELCHNEKFDVILMDLQMPVINGLKASEIIRKESNLNQNTPIIAVTGHSTGYIQEKCEEIGINGFLAKPYAFENLYHLLKEMKVINLYFSTH